jgi:hypothetical protein
MYLWNRDGAAVERTAVTEELAFTQLERTLLHSEKSDPGKGAGQYFGLLRAHRLVATGRHR